MLTDGKHWHHILKKGPMPPAPTPRPSPPPINFHRHRSVMPELFSSRAATFSSCQVAWRFPCHRLAGWSCCGSCLPLRDVHLEWGADRPDSPSPQGLCHVIQASPQALSSTPLFLYTTEGMGLAFSLFFFSICMQLQKQRSSTPPPHSQADFYNSLGRLTPVASTFWFRGYLTLASVSTRSQSTSYIPLFSPCVGCSTHF